MAQSYVVREIFRTLQGEGAQAGTPMVFVRFAGCNLWSGHDADRERDAARHGAMCPRFCDTDFVSGDRYTIDQLVDRVRSVAGPSGPSWICFTGGEPTLQLDRPLLEATRRAGFQAALETNGTRSLSDLRDVLDWVCVSPKTPGFVQRSGDELKVIYQGQPVAELAELATLNFRTRSLQVEWGPRYEPLLAELLAWLPTQHAYRLSIQTHKLLGLP